MGIVSPGSMFSFTSTILMFLIGLMVDGWGAVRDVCVDVDVLAVGVIVADLLATPSPDDSISL